MEVNDIVLIKNDSLKILYRINSIISNVATISGIYYRIILEIEMDKLVLATSDEIIKEKENNKKIFNRIINNQKRNSKYLLGRVLHLDGDEAYLDKCLELYEACGIYAHGMCIKEEKMSIALEKIITDINPDIVVITGHDMYNNQGKKDLNNYKNTNNFIKAVKVIRKNKSRFDLCIIAGACQSNFEALIASGADYASSPKRINVHTFDPAVIAIKIATTSFNRIVPFEEALKFIENGKDAYNGVETLGKMRLLY